GGCHLEAKLVKDALENIKLDEINFLVIENVGNLVCPAGYDLGEDLKVVILSTTEGDDKPLKYPKMFINSSILIINKIDLLPYVNCKITELRENALKINPNLRIFETSCTTGEGIEEWCKWILENIKK
ncbi:MAG: hydrogenase nickel incorporation protein HypB, partial [Ignavibacteriae bacterium]|nr:hydrogenase nickel incorporation protein HypB [Ignavibacteriota bacterium]